MEIYGHSWLPGEYGSMTLMAGTVALIVSWAVAVIYWRNKSMSRGSSWLDELTSSKGDRSLDARPLKDIWGGMRSINSTAASISTAGRAGHGDRPFGSSYYYAHNNSNAKGGYADGLRMEDYTMNQPRLLRKSGKPVSNEPKITNESLELEIPVGRIPTSTPSEPVVRTKENARKITKYLWDDPGDPNGIATIRIDTLPAEQNDALPWQQMKQQIVTVDAKLVDSKKGLLVMLETRDEITYQLSIPVLYGDVDAVRTVSKPKRLLIRLYKKKNWVNIFDKKNLEEWPHPYASRGKQA